MSTGDKSFPRGKKNVQGADKVGRRECWRKMRVARYKPQTISDEDQ